LNTSRPLNHTNLTAAEFLGLAPFLRLNIAGQDLLPIGQEILAKLQTQNNDPNLWMNLSTIMFCLGHRDIGLSMQAQALEIQRIYHLAAQKQPAKLRVLLLMTAGDLAANTPLDCLLENSDIELIYYFVSAEQTLALPAHDVLMVAISEADENIALLSQLQHTLANWSKPIINAAHKIPCVERFAAAQLLQNAPGLFMPPTFRLTRKKLQGLVNAKITIHTLFAGGDFPLIIRPVGSHAGKDLEKLESMAELHAYFARVDTEEYFLSQFIDYRNNDGLFRKYRIALVDSKAFACHMAVSAHWMIHYVNAGMYEDEQKRAEEAAFIADFANFAQRHQEALAAIYQRTELDYVCIDCTETADGQLFVFEIDHAMVVHGMDPEAQFAYKQGAIQELRDAFRGFLFRLSGYSL
jgi:glutathione synthase/RimK-type ligase-like ATP-grasp enzyme